MSWPGFRCDVAPARGVRRLVGPGFGATLHRRGGCTDWLARVSVRRRTGQEERTVEAVYFALVVSGVVLLNPQALLYNLNPAL